MKYLNLIDTCWQAITTEALSMGQVAASFKAAVIYRGAVIITLGLNRLDTSVSGIYYPEIPPPRCLTYIFTTECRQAAIQ